METARQKAARLLTELLVSDNVPTKPTPLDVVDAIIDAVRAPESEHTRAVAKTAGAHS